MASRTAPFVNGQIYHIFNRGVEKRKIFLKKSDYFRFIEVFNYYRYQDPKPKYSLFTKSNPYGSSKRGLFFSNKGKIVEILGYCLMPNHFHFLIKQISEGGITEFMSRISDNYTKYFNIKNNSRVGPLHQGPFKSVLIESDEQLVHVLRYIHLNPVAAKLVKDINDYPWSSYPEYIGLKNRELCLKEELLNLFKDRTDFINFHLEQIENSQELEELKKYSF